MTVSITSDNLIGGARTAVTDTQGVYRFTLLPGGTAKVSFTFPGSPLNVEGVNLSAGGAATINGKLDVAALEESITVTSQSPTIDLESSKVAVNWDQQKLDELPYSRSLTGLVGSSRPLCHLARRRRLELRHRLGPAARTFGRAGGRRQLRRHDLGPDLRRLRHLRRSANHDCRQRCRLDEPGPDDEPGAQVGQQHVQGPARQLPVG